MDRHSRIGDCYCAGLDSGRNANSTDGDSLRKRVATRRKITQKVLVNGVGCQPLAHSIPMSVIAPPQQLSGFLESLLRSFNQRWFQIEELKAIQIAKLM